MAVSTSEAPDKDLTTSDVAALLRVSQATVTRIARERLDYTTTPGGHRRYRREDVQRYAKDDLGLDVDLR